jgi:hypothetical protein
MSSWSGSILLLDGSFDVEKELHVRSTPWDGSQNSRVPLTAVLTLPRHVYVFHHVFLVADAEQHSRSEKQA